MIEEVGKMIRETETTITAKINTIDSKQQVQEKLIDEYKGRADKQVDSIKLRAEEFNSQQKSKTDDLKK